MMEKKKETTSWGLGFRVYSPPEVDKYGVYGDLFSNIPKAIFYLLKGDYWLRSSARCKFTPTLTWDDNL